MKVIQFFCISLLLSTLLLQVSCKGKKDLSKNEKEKQESNCDMVVTVKNFKGLSGCRFLLETEDGETLMPMGVNVEGYDYNIWEKTLKARVSYSIIPDGISNCMRGKMVNINCLEILEEGSPEKGNF